MARRDLPHWNLVGDSKHDVGTINIPELPDHIGKRDREFLDLQRLTPFTLPGEQPSHTPYSVEEASRHVKSDDPLDFQAAAKRAEREIEEQAKHPRKAPQLEVRSEEVQPKSYELSNREYRHLSDRERAAVDFNTLLVAAREKDLNAKYHATPKQRAEYTDSVNSLFGEGHGSKTYAPETLALLEQLGFKGGKGDDLDQFLALQPTTSRHELGKIDAMALVDKAKAAIPQPLPNTIKPDTEVQLADKTAALQEQMAKAGQLMASFRDSAASLRSDAVSFYGGTPDKVHETPGFGEPKRTQEGKPANADAYFQDAYLSLANKDNHGPALDQVWTAINGALTDKEKQQFLDYADLRSRQGLEVGALGDFDKGFHARTPEEFRKLLGLDPGGKR